MHYWGASWDKTNARIYFRISQCKFISVKTAKGYNFLHGTEMRPRNLHSYSVLVHTGYIGTGAILEPGFGTQP